MISLWEKESFLSYDVVVIGAGITGFSTALSLKEKDPGLNIVILERGTLPTGASTKNAGFACFGSLTELLHDLAIMGPDNMLALVQKRWDGLQKTRNRLGDERIDLQLKGGYELLSNSDSESISRIGEVNTLLGSLFNEEVFSLRDELIPRFGFGAIDHLVFNPMEGQLHTGKLIRALWERALQSGIHLLTGTEVTGVEENESNVRIYSKDFSFSATAVAVCTNAFTNKLLPNLDIAPGRGIVSLITPSQPLKFEGTFHYQEGFYYFRDFYGKLIFGGGRNLDLEGEKTTEFGLNPKIEAELDRLLRDVIIPETAYHTEMKWSGIMAFGPTKQPIIERTGKRIVTGVRLGGMGVAIGSMVGEEVAEMIYRTGV